MEFTEAWDTPKEILIILPHPDDPEFFLGGTIARWIKAGHTVRYVILTQGDKGAKDGKLTKEVICRIRREEQINAAGSLGVKSVDFMDYDDGYLVPDLEMRKKVVRSIRKYQPQILVTSDPENLIPHENYLNHPDHRYAGQVVIDAVFPAAGNRFFFPELLEEGFEPHEVEEVWISLTSKPDVRLNVSEFWMEKLSALKHHVSQIGDSQAFEKRMLEWGEQDENGEMQYYEHFRRIKFRRREA